MLRTNSGGASTAEAAQEKRSIQPSFVGWKVLHAVTENKFALVFTTEPKLMKMPLTFYIFRAPCCFWRQGMARIVSNFKHKNSLQLLPC